MWLVLCQANDQSVHWAVEGLRARGLTPLELISAEQLVEVEAITWEHWLDERGASTIIRLPDGRAIDSTAIRGTLNRLQWVPSADIEAVVQDDREYAVQEWGAFFLSWLNALPGPLVNRPTPRGLAGAWRSRAEWVWLAACSGLPIAPYRSSARLSQRRSVEQRKPTEPVKTKARTIIVLDKDVFGLDLPDAVREGCLRLSVAAGACLLGIELTLDIRGRWLFHTATASPDLRPGGETLLDALARTLQT